MNRFELNSRAQHSPTLFPETENYERGGPLRLALQLSQHAMIEFPRQEVFIEKLKGLPSP